MTDDRPPSTWKLRKLLDEARRCGDRELALAIFAVLTARSAFANAGTRHRPPKGTS